MNLELYSSLDVKKGAIITLTNQAQIGVAQMSQRRPFGTLLLQMVSGASVY
jgi:hypothetical protein